MSQHYHQFQFVFEQDKVNSSIISDSEVNMENVFKMFFLKMRATNTHSSLKLFQVNSKYLT